MNFATSIKRTITDMFVFTGRSSKQQFVHWIIITMIIGVICAIADVIYFPEKIFDYSDPTQVTILPNANFVISNIFNLIVALPTISLTTRRLHDVNRSGHWQWTYLTIIGVFVVFYWCFQVGEQQENRFGTIPD